MPNRVPAVRYTAARRSSMALYRSFPNGRGSRVAGLKKVAGFEKSRGLHSN